MEFLKDLKVTYRAGDINNYSGRKTSLKNELEVSLIDRVRFLGLF